MSATPLQPLEIASGLVLGLTDGAPPAAPARTPLEALEGAVRPALLRPPCLVSFSGGRDSSAVLALAADLARREGLALPIPVTNRFASATADESAWQERVVAHLRLDEWSRLEHDGELDCVGPVARSAVERHGLLWPFNAYFHVPLLRHAQPGSLLTGLGGDEMLEGAFWAGLRRNVWTNRALRRSDILALAFAAAPDAVRLRIARRQLRGRLPWLRSGAQHEVVEGLVRQAASAPLRWAPGVRRRARLRYLQVAAASLGALAGDAGVQIVHPFLDRGFASALASHPPFASRTETMRALFGRLLPEDVLSRTTKACFDEVFWGAEARSFAAEWDGCGIDTALVDPEALRAEWLSERPDPRSFLLAQSVRFVTPSSGAGTPPPRRETSGAAAA